MPTFFVKLWVVTRDCISLTELSHPLPLGLSVHMVSLDQSCLQEARCTGAGKAERPATSQQTADSCASSLWAMPGDAHLQAAPPLLADLPPTAGLLHLPASTCSLQHLQQLGPGRPAAQPAASVLSCSHHPDGDVEGLRIDFHAEQVSPPAAAVQQRMPATGKRSRSAMEAAGGQHSRVDLSRAAAVIAASLPAAQRPALSPSSNSSAEHAEPPAEEGAAAPQEQHGREQQQQSGQNKPRSPAVAVHGNYHRYYGYRLGQAVDRDPRLDVRLPSSLPSCAEALRGQQGMIVS
jgi:hypothetical protein